MDKPGNRRKRRIAVAGKGGTGKSLITGLMTRILAAAGGINVLVIDADPTMGLSNVLGVTPRKTLEDVRHEIIKVAGSGDEVEKKHLVNTLDYRIFEALAESKGFAILAMGEPKAAGCFCPANTLLKNSIETLSNNFDIVIIDCEAGLEQISRRVVGRIDTLLITTDLSMRSARTAMSIRDAAHRFTTAHAVRIVVNRVKDGVGAAERMGLETGLQVLGIIPEDDQVTEWDSKGRPVLDLPESSPSVRAVREMLERMGIYY